MNYHDIKHDDIVNGDGLRVTLFTSGCDHFCNECQNPQTWDKNGGIKFDENAKQEIFNQLENSYISGITLSGGDPLYQSNLKSILSLCKEIKKKYKTKTIWIYSGYTWEEIMEHENVSDDFYLRKEIISMCDVFVDGRFVSELEDINYHWAGSINQRVIDVKKSLTQDVVVLLEN